MALCQLPMLCVGRRDSPRSPCGSEMRELRASKRIPERLQSRGRWRGTPTTSALPMQNAPLPSVMPVSAQPLGRACSWSSSSGASLRHRPLSHLATCLWRDAPDPPAGGDGPRGALRQDAPHRLRPRAPLAAGRRVVPVVEIAALFLPRSYSLAARWLR